MASTIVFVSLLMAFSLTESSALTNTINRDTEPPTEVKSHKWGFDTDDISGRNHFADFLRALYAPAKDGPSPTAPTQLANDMANELMPISSLGDDEHDDDLHNRDLEQHAEFPTDSTGQLPILKKRNSRYCGSYLADALQMVCRSSYLPLFGKRSTGNNVIDASKGAVAPVAAWPFVNTEKAHSMMSNQRLFHRYTRGVHDECCVKGCSFKELTAYCTDRSY